MKKVCAALMILVMWTSALAFTVSAEEKSGVCGEDLTWTLDDEGTLTISGTGDMYNFVLMGYGDITFPEGYCTCPWDYRELVRKVVIEDGVASIGNNAFNCLDKIAEVVLPDSLRSIGDFAFAMCSSLQEISIPSSVDEFGNGVFADTPFLEREFAENGGGLYINDILVQADTPHEGEFVIKDGTKRIGPYAFWSSYCVDSLFIPKSVEDLSAINLIVILKQVVIDENNPYYTVNDGVIFSKDKTELIYCTNSKEGEYTIPDGVKAIAPEAFSFSRLDSIIFSDSVEEIGAGAFSCADIGAVTISKSIRMIPDRAFDSCQQLKDVCYDGTEAEWNTIVIGEENDALLNASMHFLKLEEPEETAAAEETTAPKSASEESFSSDTDVEDETTPTPDNDPKYKSKQTGDPITALFITAVISLSIGSFAFAILACVKKKHTDDQ